jgi:hypothetical protein
LDLADSFIEDAGCGVVAQFVVDNARLEGVDLKGNNIGAEGIA